MIAALYVAPRGAYFGLDGVDPWDEERDARKYDGADPVGNHVKSGEVRPRVGKDAASKTPPEFRDILINMARSALVDTNRRSR